MSRLLKLFPLSRFRTYFPDAYKQHYPNAKTHLSSKVRSALPDGSSIFEKTRSKKRRPFTEEEDRALKAGYDKHGTVWATIVKDPIFQEQNRRSTDLRDRFRNAFPELYQAAGYKPRLSAKKKKELGLDVSPPEPTSCVSVSDAAKRAKSRGHPIRAATDDQLSMGHDGLGPVRRKRRHTTQGLYRGGTKSVPESTTNSEDEESGSDGEDEKETPPSSTADNTTPNSVQPPTEELFNDSNGEVDMDVQPLDTLGDHLSMPDFMSSDLTDSSQTTTWSSLDTPLHTWTSSTSSTSNGIAASPSPTNEYLLPHSPVTAGANTMIGKSAWGPQDWLSANPRLDASGATSSSNSSYIGGSAAFSPSTHPSSPSTFSSSNNHPLSHASLNHLQSQQGFPHSQFTQSHTHGVFDRYDLFSNSLSHDIDFDFDFISEGFGGETTDEQSAFSDPSAWTNGGGMRGGFTHHSNYAGDLIFGARTHQPSGHMHMDYSHGFGLGSNANSMDIGLGLEGVQPSGAQTKSGLHTPALPGIDEIELTNITLDDREFDTEQDVLTSRMDASNDSSKDSDASSYTRPLALEEIVGLPASDDEPPLRDGQDNDMSIAMTPPHTPYTGARSSGRASVPGMHTPYGAHNHHNRSVSVPPSEHRNPDPRSEMAHSQTPNPQRKYKPLPTTTTRPTFQPFQLPPSMPPPTITPSQTQTVSQARSPPHAHHVPASCLPPGHSSSVPYKVPYLDLHYYTTLSPGIALPTAYPKSHLQGHAQALDLAQSVAQVAQAQAHSPSKPLCISPSSLMQFSGSGASVASTGPSASASSTRHQRGLSAISPQDLLVRKGSENKRKRASWDGGAS